MKRAVAIRLYGDPEIGEPLKNALVVQTQSEEVERLRGELRESRRREAQYGVRKVRDKAYFANKMLELNESPPVREMGMVSSALLIAWAVTTLTICEAFRRLDDWVMHPEN